MKKKIISICLLFIAGFSFSNCLAQYSFNNTINATVTIPPVLSWNVTYNNTSTINFSNATQYTNGVTLSNFTTIQVKGNTPWMVNVAASTPYFSASGTGASANMPANILGFSVDNIATIYRLSTVSQKIKTGASSATGTSFNLNLIATPGYNYGAGIYSIVINYTLTAQ